MAKRTWIGGDTTVAQVETFQVTAADAASTYRLKVTDEGGTEELIVTGAGDAAVNTCASNLSTAWNDSIHPLASSITASVSTDTVTLTADTVGIPFYVTADVSGGTGTIGSGTISTASRGPNDYNDPFNWKEGEIPAAGPPGDDVVITGSVSILYGLDQSGVAIDGFTVVGGSSVEIGNESFPLQIDPDSFTWSGKGISYIDTGTADFTEHNIWDTAEPGGPEQSGLYLKHVQTAQDLNIWKGNVGIALSAGDVSTFDNIWIRGSNVTLTVGDSVTINTAVDQVGGTSIFRSNPKAITLHGGTMLTSGVTYTVNSCVIGGGIYFMNHGATCNNITVNEGGTFDSSSNPHAITLGGTAFSVKPGGTVIVDPTNTTFTNLPTPSEKSRILFTNA